MELDCLPVRFGSHHWRATDPVGRALFLSIDDLHKSQTSTPDGTLDAAHERLPSSQLEAYTAAGGRREGRDARRCVQ